MFKISTNGITKPGQYLEIQSNETLD